MRGSFCEEAFITMDDFDQNMGLDLGMPNSLQTVIVGEDGYPPSSLRESLDLDLVPSLLGSDSSSTSSAFLADRFLFDEDDNLVDCPYDYSNRNGSSQQPETYTTSENVVASRKGHGKVDLTLSSTRFRSSSSTSLSSFNVSINPIPVATAIGTVHEDPKPDSSMAMGSCVLHPYLPSKEEEFKTVYGKRPYSLGDSNSKNAVAARDNRLKKKRYVASLEASVKTLRAENERLSRESSKSQTEISRLRTEVAYLKSVLANQTTIAGILKNVVKTPGIKLSTSFMQESPTSSESTVHKNIGEKSSHTSSSSEDVNVPSSIQQSRNTRSKSKSLQTLTKLETLRESQKKKILPCHSKSPQERLQESSEDEDVDITEVSSTSESSSLSTAFADTHSSSAGVCLYVSGDNVSLEFCSHCHSSARAGLISDHSYVKM